MPIYKGVQEPIIKVLKTIPEIHGEDGFGNQQDKYIDKANLELIKEDNAVLAIINHVNEEYKQGHKVCLATIGPLTNLALAIKLDSSLPSKISRYYCMGGTVNAWGNMDFSTEFNFMCDPEAAFIVYSKMPYIHLNPWETCELCKINPDNV